MNAFIASARFTLGEGKTPLVDSVSEDPLTGGRLLFKLESCNPTGSYKDRFVAAEVRRMLQTGAKACVATSSGNTGSALAAYCARAGLACILVVNQNAPEEKLLQMRAHGAIVLRVPRFVTDSAVTSDVLQQLKRLSEERSVPLVISAFAYSPVGMRGVEEIAVELCETAPDHVFVPVGGGGLYSAVVQGFLRHMNPAPRVHAVQPSGCLTLVGAYLDGTDTIPIPESTTTISGLSVPGNFDASRGLALLRECGGTGIAVEDGEVFDAQRHLFLREGIYCEPAGATAYAGWKQAVQRGIVRPDETSVCLVTGHGFKDLASAQQIAEANPSRMIEAGSLAQHILAVLEIDHARS